MRNKFRIDGDIVYIELITKDGEILETMIDLEDFDLIDSNKNWHSLKQDKSIGVNYYVCGHRRVNNVGTTIKMHRLIMNIIDPKVCIDHINHNTLDNRKCNLRIVTSQENNFNRRCKGYCWNKKANKWKAYIYLDYKSIHLGYFNTEEEARSSYLEAKEKYHNIQDKEIVIDNTIYEQTEHYIKGYSWSKSCNKWRAEIFIDGKNKYLGLFNTEEEARKAYLEAKNNLI